ncbi:MAG: methylated-DNA--[protein]-cysteine S-methyltransferase [Candidatus Anammoximicrobium sp.]|nr:methylated-DNA--[protein]-cysteine S-methyltransferase [Candidatus Anammoximicrobium sp.]
MSQDRRPEPDPPPVYVFPSALGWVAVQWHERQLCALAFGWSSGAEAAGAVEDLACVPVSGWHDIGQNPNAAGDPVRRFAKRIQAYAAGRRDDFLDVPVALDETSVFRRGVLEECRRIPYGQTLSYGELAAKAGFSGAARAVGTVMAGNPVPLVIPCHRVVGSTGALRGYSGAGGVAMKQRLLELEAAIHDARTGPIKRSTPST